MHIQTCSQCGAKNQINDDADQKGTVLCEKCGEELATAATFQNENSRGERRFFGLMSSRSASELNEQFSNLQISYILIIVNLVVFISMLASGVNPLAPDSKSIYDWGADFGPSSMGNEPWRLISSMFLHIGIFHLGFNMYALFSIGPITENLYGKTRFLILYLLSGISGSLISVCWNPNGLSAGASGAIFGLFGGMLGLLLMRKSSFPSDFVQQQLPATIFFIGFNVIYGFTNPIINNAAHLGGLASGFVLALALKPDIDSWRLSQLNPRIGFINPNNTKKWWQKFDLKQVTGIVLIIFVLCLALLTARTRVNNSAEARVWQLQYASDKIEIQPNKNIYFSNGATREEARNLGEQLQKKKLFDGANGADVFLSKNNQNYEIYLIVEDDENSIKFYQNFADELSLNIFDKKNLVINLCDDELKINRIVKSNQ